MKLQLIVFTFTQLSLIIALPTIFFHSSLIYFPPGTALATHQDIDHDVQQMMDAYHHYLQAGWDHFNARNTKIANQYISFYESFFAVIFI